MPCGGRFGEVPLQESCQADQPRPQLLAIKLFFPPAGPFLQSARASDAAKPEVVEDDCEPTKYNLDGKAKPGTDSNAVEPAEHHDEYQVLLDTNRSFVTYPKGNLVLQGPTGHH
jgi:hypothetical protein